MKPYSKLQQWKDSMWIIDEFIRFFTYEAHITFGDIEVPCYGVKKLDCLHL
jgi:hypothetical protein